MNEHDLPHDAPETQESRAAYLKSDAYKAACTARMLAIRYEPKDDEREISEYMAARQRIAHDSELQKPDPQVVLRTAIYFFKNFASKSPATNLCRNDMAKFTAKEVSQIKDCYKAASEVRIDLAEDAYREMECDRDALIKAVAENNISILNLRQLERNPPAVNEIRTIAEIYKNQMN